MSTTFPYNARYCRGSSHSAHTQIRKHILCLISVVVTWGIYDGFYANCVWYYPAPQAEIHRGKNVHRGHILKLAFLRPLSPSCVCASYFGCQYMTPEASSLKSNSGGKKCRENKNVKEGWTLTSETDTEAGGVTSEWLWVAGSQSGDRPRPPATPRCQPRAGDRALGHLLTFASVSRTLMRG